MRRVSRLTVKQVPEVLIFRSSATLYFANAEMYQEALGRKTGFDITKLLAAKKKLEAKRERHEKKEAKKAKKEAKKEAKKNGQTNQGEPVCAEMNDVAVIAVEPERDPSLPRAIVLDLSPVNFLDTVGVKTLRTIRKDYGEIGIDVVLTGCQPGVVQNLETGGFFNDKVTKCCVFSSIHDAVLHCQCHCETERPPQDKEIKALTATYF